MKDKIIELSKNEEFAKKMKDVKSKEEALSVMKEFGIEEDSLETFIAEVKNFSGDSLQELSDDELDGVVGGSFFGDIGNFFERLAFFTGLVGYTGVKEGVKEIKKLL